MNSIMYVQIMQLNMTDGVGWHQKSFELQLFANVSE